MANCPKKSANTNQKRTKGLFRACRATRFIYFCPESFIFLYIYISKTNCPNYPKLLIRKGNALFTIFELP